MKALTDIKSMTEPELEDFMKSLGEPRFRAGQIFTWLQQGAESFDDMTNISKKQDKTDYFQTKKA